MKVSRLYKAFGLSFCLLWTAGVNAAGNIGPERLLLVTQQWRPYQYQENGEMRGPGIDKIKCVMKGMQQPYQLTMTSWDRAQILTEVGDQHGFFLASKNDIRDKYALYSDPVMNQAWSWFSLSDSIDTQSTMFKEQITVTALFGSNKWFWLQKQGYRVEKKPRHSGTLVELLLTGEVGAVLANDFVMEDAIKQLGVSHRAITKNRIKEKPLGVYFSKKFTKQYPRFLKAFNEAVAQCKGS